MKEECAALSSLGVSRNFPVINRKIADATERSGRLPSLERSGDPFENESIGAADVREIRMQCERHRERIGETARSLQDGSAPAGAPQDLDRVLFAGGDIDLVDEPARPTQHHEIAVALPDAQDRIAFLLIQFIEQSLIEREILYRRGEGEIEQAEGGHGITASMSWTCRDGWLVHGTFRPLP